MNRFKKPWYIWFSLLALIILSGDTAVRVKFMKGYWENFDLWIRACGFLSKLWFLYLFIPSGVLTFLSGYILSLADYFIPSASQHPLTQEILDSLVFLVIYLLNVYSTYKLVLWRNKNIPHLLTGPFAPKKNKVEKDDIENEKENLDTSVEDEPQIIDDNEENIK